MTKRIVTTLLTATLLLGTTSIGASASWRKDSKGWWYTEGTGFTTGWKNIEGEWYYFDQNGYMKTGWVYDGVNWYYMWDNGIMAKNTKVGDYYLGPNGAWDKTASNTIGTTISENKSEIVYVLSNGSKYHYKNSCGNMTPSNAIETTKDQVIKQGYDECNKCN